jgi:hypothetical protein
MKIEFDAERDLVMVNLLAEESVASSNQVGGVVIGQAADHRVVTVAISGARERIKRELQKVVHVGVEKSEVR